MELLNKCPVCGGSLYQDELYQYAIYHKINKRNGNISKKTEKHDIGSMEVTALFCENGCFKTDYELTILKPFEK